MTDVTIFLDPDGTRDFGLLLLVESDRGVRYRHQVAGHACQQRAAQGFLIPIGDPSTAQPLLDFFASNFHGNPPRDGWWMWSEEQRSECAKAVGKLTVWHDNHKPEGEWVSLSVDVDRGEAVTEGWIPVTTPFGPSIVLFRNSD